MSLRLGVASKDKLFVIVSFIYILYVIFPLFGDLTNIPVFVPSLLVVFFIAICNNGIFTNKPVRWLLAYFILLFIYTLIGKPIHINGVSSDLPGWWRITIEAAWAMPAVMIAAVLYYKNDTNLYKLFGIGSLVLITISFLYILPLIISSKNILRDDLLDISDVHPLGLPDYALMHAYTLMLIPFCFSLKTTVYKHKFLSIGLLCLFFYLVTQTAVTTSLFVSVAIFFFSIIYSAEHRMRFFVLCVMSVLILYVLYEFGFFLWLVDSLMPLFDGTAVSFKLQDLHDSMVGGRIQGGSITGRMDYHQISKDNFWYNPIFGGGFAGGHSKILDILGGMGIIVFIPFAMSIWSCLKQQISQTRSLNARSFIYFSYFAACIYLYEKGIFSAAGYLTTLVIVPSALIALDRWGETR